MIQGIDLKIVNHKDFKGHDGMMGHNLDLVYKGKKIAHSYDDAWGGGSRYTPLGEFDTKEYNDNKKAFDELVAEVKEATGDKYPQMKLDCLVEDLINEKVMQKDFKKGIVCKHPSGHEVYGWKIQIPAFIRKYKNGLEEVQKYYDELKADGKEILNAGYLQSIGIVL